MSLRKQGMVTPKCQGIETIPKNKGSQKLSHFRRRHLAKLPSRQWREDDKLSSKTKKAIAVPARRQRREAVVRCPCPVQRVRRRSGFSEMVGHRGLGRDQHQARACVGACACQACGNLRTEARKGMEWDRRKQKTQGASDPVKHHPAPNPSSKHVPPKGLRRDGHGPSSRSKALLP